MMIFRKIRIWRSANVTSFKHKLIRSSSHLSNSRPCRSSLLSVLSVSRSVLFIYFSDKVRFFALKKISALRAEKHPPKNPPFKRINHTKKIRFSRDDYQWIWTGFPLCSAPQANIFGFLLLVDSFSLIKIVVFLKIHDFSAKSLWLIPSGKCPNSP